jgi:SAM-dependent methyltransferase
MERKNIRKYFSNGKFSRIIASCIPGYANISCLSFNTDTVFDSISRDLFANLIFDQKFGNLLEIGPLNRPIISGSNVKYFDIHSTKELRKKAASEGLDPTSVPNIDYSHPEGDLGSVVETFDAIVSAHCIEHQPDLVRHLKQVERLLKTKGRYYLVIPDHRYCFDHFISPSKLSEIVKAYSERRVRPDIYQVIEHRALTCHNDPKRHWQSNHGDPLLGLKDKWELAEQEFYRAAGTYIDVHCWQFDPASFQIIIRGLFELGLVGLQIDSIFSTAENDLEFFAILVK